jgi:hypothetical protein
MATGRLFVDASGRVGVGNASPGTQASEANALVVGSGTGNQGISIVSGTGSEGGLYFADGGGGGAYRGKVLYDHVTDSLQLDTANTERLRITSAGLVGIGTSSPSAKLYVNNTSLIAPSLTYGATAGQTFKNELSELAFGTDTSAPYAHWLQARFSLNTPQVLALNPSGGNVGIGTTSPPPGALLAVNGQPWVLNQNALLFMNADNTLGCYINGSGAGGVNPDMVFSTSYNERARIDSSGRLLVGTSTARSNFYNTTAAAGFLLEGTDAQRRAAVIGDDFGGSLILGMQKSGAPGGNTIVVNGDGVGEISFQGNDGSEFVACAQIKAEIDNTPGANDMPGRLVFSTTADGASSPTERMRITNDGRITIGRALGVYDDPTKAKLHVYTSAADGNYALAVHHDGNSTNSNGVLISCGQDSGTGTLVQFTDGDGSGTGSITFSSLTTAYNTSSDYRLKENVVALTGATGRLSQIPVYQFNFIGQSDKTFDGFLAHEVQTVVPEAITGEKDAVDDEGNPQYQGIDQSKLVPLLTAALQEAIGRIETLEAEVAALKGA